ncbi:MAG: pyridine nucleotide-disulfide oxidoreductase [Pelagibacteraceae bacterium]|nr:pyridine nucleotide-disulfide oxidoreductase [Pelagibacteraceae bacterium]|tara:strand:- start:2037 stop:3332 length:1296 start_codon:yes stop_codon:yes gene_type:complete
MKGPSVVIIGSGPSGFYTAESITKKLNSNIDIIDRLPTPFGLIRGGVAPDHQTTKRISLAYSKTAKKEQINFFGNIEIGKDISIDELREIYDVVVLAIGSEIDNKLEIKGNNLKGVYGSAEIVGWYNGHPDYVDLEPNLNTENVVVIGNGNVAIDIVRVLSKTPEEMLDSDIPEYALNSIDKSPIKNLYIVGRRGPIEAKFTNVELREMGNLKNCLPVVNIDLPDNLVGNYSERDQRLIEKNLETLRSFVSLKKENKEKKINFNFFQKPIEIIGNDKVEIIKFEKTNLEDGKLKDTGEITEIKCGLVVTAIGYKPKNIPGLKISEGVVENNEGRIDKGFYASGWIRRGPTGVIGTNKADGELIANLISKEFKNQNKNGRNALIEIIKNKNLEVTSFEDWEKIDSYEKENAKDPTPRKKILTIKEMLNLCKI